jgi:PilZ domain
MRRIEPATVATSERRRSERKPYVVEAFIVSPTATCQTERKEVTSVNVSRHGIAFDFEMPLAKKTYFKMEIAVGEQRTVTEVKIISCRPIEDGMYQIGAEFC